MAPERLAVPSARDYPSFRRIRRLFVLAVVAAATGPLIGAGPAAAQELRLGEVDFPNSGAREARVSAA